MNAFNVRENINPNVEFDEVFNEMIDCLSSYSTPTAMMDEAVRMHYEAEDNLTQNDFEKQQQAMIDRAEKREEDRIQDELNKQEALSEEDYERMRQGFDEQERSNKESKEDAERNDEEIKPIGTNKWGNVYQGKKGKAKEYAHFLEREKSGYVKDAFSNKELGNIDLNWGNEKGGLKHIIDKHIKQRNDFASLDEAIDTIEDVLANGEMTEQGTNRSFDYNGYRISVAQSNEGKWVITAFEKTRSKENKERKSDTTIGDQSTDRKENGTLVSPDLLSNGKDTTVSENEQEKGEKNDKDTLKEDRSAKNITERESKRKGMLGVVLDALRKAIGKDNVITDSEEAQRVIDEVNGRVRPEMTEDVFYSNAERSVENISQDKATPEQWLKMIEKQGGLKAGEDKWLGLSDWLKDSKEKTLTKQEVLDHIRANEIQMEEVNYREENKYNKIAEDLRSEWDIEDGILSEAEERVRDEYELEEDELLEWDWVNDKIIEILEERYGDDILDHIEYDNDGNFEPIDSSHQGHIINSTRLQYTTEGLDNNREIAFVIPNVESWNKNDKVHFGDAGKGRAVMWVRFGETTDKDGKRVLVIDEIQSKRHQEGREKGYKGFELTKIEQERTKALKDQGAYIRKLAEKYGAFQGDRAFPLEHWTKEEKEKFNALQAEINKANDSLDNYEKENGYSYNKVPDAPFEKNWHEVAMKRMLRYAAENGYDKVAWTTGEQQAERYNIGNVVESIIYYDYPARKDKEGRNTKKIVIRSHNNEPMSMRVNNDGLIIDAGSELRGKNLMEVLGKELAAKILNGDGSDITLWDESMDNPAKEINGNGLRIGGEGMKGFYDQMLPRFMDKYGKKWGVKTQDVELPEVEEAGRIMHSVDVTDEMRRSVMEGQPLFQRVSSEEVNKRFNEELDEFKDKQLKGGILHLGEPNGLLIACGLNASEITLTAKTLKEHLDKHGISIEEIKDLPNAINNPMMVYEWGTKAKSTIIITNITRESGDKITVAVKLERNGEEMTINEIASIHGKEGQLFISDMISKGEHNIDNSLKYVQENRKEVLDWLGLDSPKESASLTNEELHIAKVLQTFKNPAIIEQKNEKNLKEHRLVGGNSGYVGYSMSKRAEQAREEGRYPKTDFKKVYNISDKTLKALVSAGIIDDNEWHHTSKYGNKTTFYGWSEEKFATIYRLFKKEIDAIVKDNQPETNPYKYTEWSDFSEEFQALPYNVKKDKGSKELQEFLNNHPEDKAKYEENERYNQWQAQAPSPIESNRVIGEKLNQFFDEKDVKFFKTKDGEAYGFTVGGKVYVDERIADASTPIHEYTHLWAEALRKVNPKEWQNIVSLMKKQTHLWDKVKNDYPELKTDDEIADEVLAHYSGERGKKLLDEEYNKIRDNNKMNIFDKAKMLQAINNVREALRKFWKGVADFLGIHFTSAEEVADKVLSDLLEGVNPNEVKSEEEKIIERAKADGTYMKAPNGKKSNLSERQWVQVRTKAFKKWFGDWEKSARIEKLRKSESITATGNEYKGKYELNNKSADNYIKENLRGEYTNKDTKETIKITRIGAEKVTRHDIESEIHLKSVALIPEMLEKAIFITEETNEKAKRGFDSYKYYVVGLKIDGVDYTAKMVVGVKNGQTYYDHALTEISKEKLLNERDRISTSVYQKEQSFDTNNVKDKRLLSILEENSSKILDENGEPKVVYHQTSEHFYTFDIDKARKNSDVQAFFFSDGKEEWRDMGKNTMAVFLNIRKITEKPLLNGQDNAGVTAREELQSQGYDGTIEQEEEMETEYAVFNSNQVKSATDNVGTFDSENADIRFHKSTERVVEKATDKDWRLPASIYEKERMKYIHSLLEV